MSDGTRRSSTYWQDYPATTTLVAAADLNDFEDGLDSLLGPTRTKPPRVHAHLTADSAVANNAWTLATSWTADTDPLGMYSGGAITIPALGGVTYRWRLHWWLHWTVSTAGVRYHQITVNSTSASPANTNILRFAPLTAPNGYGAGDSFEMTYSGPLNSGDVVRFAVWQNSAATLSLTAATVAKQDSGFDLTLLGPA